MGKPGGGGKDRTFGLQAWLLQNCLPTMGSRRSLDPLPSQGHSGSLCLPPGLLLPSSSSALTSSRRVSYTCRLLTACLPHRPAPPASGLLVWSLSTLLPPPTPARSPYLQPRFLGQISWPTGLLGQPWVQPGWQHGQPTGLFLCMSLPPCPVPASWGFDRHLRQFPSGKGKGVQAP